MGLTVIFVSAVFSHSRLPVLCLLQLVPLPTLYARFPAEAFTAAVVWPAAYPLEKSDSDIDDSRGRGFTDLLTLFAGHKTPNGTNH